MARSSNGQAGNIRKRRKGQNSAVNAKRVAANILKSGQTAQHTKKVNGSDKSGPSAEKEAMLEKKETVPENCQEYKPVVDVKTPEDYSANWKRLKEVRSGYFLC